MKVAARSKLVPCKLYHYHSVIHSLEQFIQRKEFLSKCEQGPNRPDLSAKDCQLRICTVTYMMVVFGKNFQYINGIPFLSAPHNYSLTLNVDWFNPFKWTEYSAGAIYLTI